MARNGGQASIEFVVCAAVLAVALLAPVVGGESIAGRLLDALVRLHRNHVFLLALS